MSMSHLINVRIETESQSKGLLDCVDGKIPLKFTYVESRIVKVKMYTLGVFLDVYPFFFVHVSTSGVIMNIIVIMIYR